MRARAWNDLSGADLAALVDRFKTAVDAETVLDWCLVAFWRDAHWLGAATDPEAPLGSLENTLEGRLFCRAAELRWRHDAGVCHAVGLAPANLLATLDGSNHDDLNLVPASTTTRELRGEWSAGTSTWSDGGRRAEPLAYAIDGKRNGTKVRIHVETLDESLRNGQRRPAFERYVRLEVA